MKTFIWIFCFLCYGAIITTSRNNGILLGAIPTILLVSITTFVAHFLCKLWDRHKERKIHEETLKRYPNPTINHIANEDVKKRKPTNPTTDTWVCSKCNSRNLGNRTDCWSCGQKNAVVNSQPPQHAEKNVVTTTETTQNSHNVIEHLLCTNCGAKLPTTYVFCNKCGAKAKNDSPFNEPPIYIDSLFSIEEEHIGKHVQIMGSYYRGTDKAEHLKCYIREFNIRGGITIDVNLVKPLPDYIVNEYNNYDSPPVILRGILGKSSSPFYRYVLNQAEYQGYWRNSTGKIHCEKSSCGHKCSKDCPIYLNKLGEEMYKEYNRDEALELFNRTVFLAPDYADAWCNLGYLYLDSQKYDEAYEHFYEAQKYSPQKERTIYGEIISLSKIGRLKEAQDLLGKYQNLFPNKKSSTLSNIVNDALSKVPRKPQTTDEEYRGILKENGFDKFWDEVVAEKVRAFATQACKYSGSYARRIDDLKGFTRCQIEEDANNPFYFRKRLISDNVDDADSMLLFDVIDEYDSRYNVIIY